MPLLDAARANKTTFATGAVGNVFSRNFEPTVYPFTSAVVDMLRSVGSSCGSEIDDQPIVRRGIRFKSVSITRIRA